MKKILLKSLCVTFFLISAYGCSAVTTVEEKPPLTFLELSDLYMQKFETGDFGFEIPAYSKVESVDQEPENNLIRIKTNKRFSYREFREDDVAKIYNETKKLFGPAFSNYSFRIETMNFPIEEFVPNFYRSDKKKYDKRRMPFAVQDRPNPVTKNVSKPIEITSGLNNRNIVLWHSHGWYYNHELDRWLWQRARLFQMVEDIGTISFTLPFLVPMLENAGANVFIPRERDTQLHEIIIDDFDESKNYVEYSSGNIGWKNGEGKAFSVGSPPYAENFNPFESGSYRTIKTNKEENARAEYIPFIPEAGEYAVYISYKSVPNSADKVNYTVFHSGGNTTFLVNQQIGGGTWIYIGTFKFSNGKNPEIGKVVVSNKFTDDEHAITTDAIKFGGGMGNVLRNGAVSGRPKYVEGSRYWLQFAGMPDTLVYNLNENKKDYNDDYQSRGEYANYLAGAPFGPNKDRSKGLGIPIDVSLSFHTDAGITKNDTVIGTLSIYSILDADSNLVFPDGMSRIANRDLADILQTQLVDDIRAKYDPVWNRRQLMEAQYSEAARPNMPSVLLELLSHQNLLDCKFMLDPNFRFDVSRSIYKSFLKFISAQNGFNFTVQPLPITHLTIEKAGANSVKISWQPKSDPVEPTAEPSSYILYKRINNNGFDNGTAVDKNEIVIDNLSSENIYSFKVTAVNPGGESFPSEILSVHLNKKTEPILIVNGFDRVAPPASVNTPEFAGFLDFVDMGVPFGYDLSYTGSQHNFNPNSQWATDDIPGHGASYADQETKKIAGNTFDFSFIHGTSFKELGYSFVSVSDESVFDGFIDLNKYSFVDLILGEEKKTKWQKPIADTLNGIQFEAFPAKFQDILKNYFAKGGKLFVSGAYVASDLFSGTKKDSMNVKFAKDVLKYKLDSDHAVKNGKVIAINKFLPENFEIEFNTELNDKIYKVEAPDAVGPVKGTGSETLLRYKENLYSAAIGYNMDYGVVAFGFPFETVVSEASRNLIMKAVLDYLSIK
ncbi:MAG: fibronectin type III domain-containing protein [Bacteroidetes bacterium]|nr:fibronectin type III domain-containing protein [Bacteroidota bacterium]